MPGYIFFYLTAALKYFEYMKIPLALFPPWIVEQYDLSKHHKDGWVHLEMKQAVWEIPQAGIMANKKLRWKSAPFGYHKCVDTPGLWKHESRPLTFTLVLDDFGVCVCVNLSSGLVRPFPILKVTKPCWTCLPPLGA